MPVKYLSNIKSFRYGTTGKAYKVSQYGKEGAREKALAQGQAIKLSQLRSQGENISQPKSSTSVRASSRARGYERRI